MQRIVQKEAILNISIFLVLTNALLKFLTLFSDFLIARTALMMRRIGTCENDEILGIGAPQLDKMNSVAEAEAGMTAEHDTGLPVLRVNNFILHTRHLLRSGD